MKKFKSAKNRKREFFNLILNHQTTNINTSRALLGMKWHHSYFFHCTLSQINKKKFAQNVFFVGEKINYMREGEN